MMIRTTVTLKPSSNTEQMLHYEIPRNGDIVQNITIEGAVDDVNATLVVTDSVVWTGAISAHQTITIPNSLNLIRIGYHTARLTLSTYDGFKNEPYVTATFLLFDDIEYRQGLSSSKWWWDHKFC